jgi:hypothetical protein
MITLEKFTNDFYVLGFDLTPDRESEEEHVSLSRQGNVRIEARFKNPLPEPVTCILYAEFPGHIEITVQIHKVLTKHVKYFQGVYPIDLLPSTQNRQ